MDTELKEYLTRQISNKDFDFEFSVDFQGNVEYVIFEYGCLDNRDNEEEENFLRLFLRLLIEKGIVPIGERTEGEIVVKSGVVYSEYKVCTQVGEDWGDDEWEEHEREDLLLNVVE
jgi:hypothetical protein